MINLDWEKVDGLIPAIIQDHETLEILMLGYMNKEALKLTQSSGYATFYSRTRKNYGLKVRPLEINLQLKIFCMIVIKIHC